MTWHKHDTNLDTLPYALLWARGSASCSIAESPPPPPAPSQLLCPMGGAVDGGNPHLGEGGESADGAAAAAADIRQERNDWIQE